MRTWGVGEGALPAHGEIPRQRPRRRRGHPDPGTHGPPGAADGRRGGHPLVRGDRPDADQCGGDLSGKRHTGSYSMMEAVASGEADVYQVRENVHAHTLHMTLLGLAALYEATGSEEYRRVVLGCVDRIRETMIFITGGMSSGERYVPYPFYNPRNDIEVCPMHSWGPPGQPGASLDGKAGVRRGDRADAAQQLPGRPAGGRLQLALHDPHEPSGPAVFHPQLLQFVRAPAHRPDAGVPLRPDRRRPGDPSLLRFGDPLRGGRRSRPPRTGDCLPQRRPRPHHRPARGAVPVHPPPAHPVVGRSAGLP